MGLITPDLSGEVDGQVADAVDFTNPFNTIINVINGGLDTNNFTAAGTNLSVVAQGVAFTSWTPVYTAAGSMTYGTVTTSYAKYMKIGRFVIFSIYAGGTTGGTASNGIIFTLPVTAAVSTNLAFGGLTADTGAGIAAFGYISDTTHMTVNKYDASNYGLGASRVIAISGVYESAS